MVIYMQKINCYAETFVLQCKNKIKCFSFDTIQHMNAHMTEDYGYICEGKINFKKDVINELKKIFYCQI